MGNALANCNADSNGMCTLSLDFSSGSEGSLAVDNFLINYVVPADNVRAGLKGESTDVGNVGENGGAYLNLTDELNKYINSSCNTKQCIIPLELIVQNYRSLLKVGELHVEYEVYKMEESLLNEILKCWDKVERGKKKKDIMCKEFIVPSDYKFVSPITEGQLAAILKNRNLCHVLPDSSHGCGSEDSLELTKNINSHTNILIEYISERRSIVVS